MPHDSLGRTRSPAQDAALRRVNDARSTPGAYSQVRRIGMSVAAHVAFAALTPVERGAWIEAALRHKLDTCG